MKNNLVVKYQQFDLFNYKFIQFQSLQHRLFGIFALFFLVIAFSGCDNSVQPHDSDKISQTNVKKGIQAQNSAAAVDLNNWTAESYNNASWGVASDGSSVLQTINGDPTFFYSDFEAFKTDVEGKIKVETTGDDDFIGFALGFQPGDTENAEADYLLVDWKKGNQTYNFGCESSLGKVGLAVSRVTGVPSRDELWGHFDNDCSTGGLEELARGNNFGETGWSHYTDYTFSFQFTATLLKVYVNGELEFDIEGEFSNGRLAFYNFSQAQVRYSAFTLEEFNNPPVAVDDTYEVNEDETLAVTSPGVLANDTDPDSDVLTAELVSGPSNGSLTLNPDGSFEYIPNPDYNGTDSFTYRAFDGDLYSDPATVTITIHPVNDTPVAVLTGPDTGLVGEELTFDGSGSYDVDGDDLTYQWNFGDGTTENGTNSIVNHTFTPTGIYEVTLIVNDGELSSEPESLTVTITMNDDEGPTITELSVLPDPVEIGELVTIEATATDVSTGESNIDKIEYNLDGGALQLMTAVDGSFDSPTESATAQIGPFSDEGQYIVCVRATDAAGNTGEESCEVFEVIDLSDPGDGPSFPDKIKISCMNGGWETLTDSEGTGFKNQGACIRYYASSGSAGGKK